MKTLLVNINFEELAINTFLINQLIKGETEAKHIDYTEKLLMLVGKFSFKSVW